MTGAAQARLRYSGLFLLLLGTEVYIALYVHDNFVRPYLGDVLVVVLLWSGARVLWPRGLPWLPGAAAGLACAVEAGQYFGLVDRLRLGHIPFFRVLLGSVFDWADLLCYLAGGGIALLAEAAVRRRTPR